MKISRRQIIAQLGQQKLVSIVSIIGTALAIFLIMIVVTFQSLQVEPFSPESARDRMLHWRFMTIKHQTWEDGGASNGPLSYDTFK